MSASEPSPAAGPTLDLVANARLPSRRAQSLQVVRVAASFAQAGADVRLLHARRVPTPELPSGESLFTYYGVRGLSREPRVEAVPCTDWIDRTPTRLQFVPARMQELTFAKRAAKRVLAGRDGRATDLALTRELETARWLVRAGHPAVFLELHRLPGGRLRRRWLGEALGGICGAIAISGGVAEDLRATGLEPERLIVEHDGVDVSIYDGSQTQAAARAEIGVEPDTPLVVYAGSLLPWKGVEVLVDAARLLPDVQVVVAGGSELEVAALRERGKGCPNLRLDGHQPPTRVPSYVQAADVFCVPNRSHPAISARYTSPLKVFEAMAAGVPIVASDLPSLRDILKPDTEAVFVQPDSPTALAEGLRVLLGDPHRRYHMSKRLRIRAPRHSWERRAQRLLEWMTARTAARRAG